MPVVPKYQGGVQDRGIPTDRVAAEAPLSAFGGGDAIQGAFNQAEKFVNTVQNRMDQTALIEADNQLTVARNEIMNQVRQQKRAAAAGAPEIAEKSFNDAVDKIRGNLNGRQQQAFDKLSSAGWKSTYDDVNKHMLSESQAWKKETNAAGIQINQNDAINNYLDDRGNVNYGRIDQSLMKQATIRDIEQQDEGYGDDVKSLRKLKDSTETHSAVINNMLAQGLDLKAKEYYQKYENQIDKEAAKSVVAALESGSTRVAAVDLADSLIARGIGERAAFAEVQKAYAEDKNVDKRILAESRLRTHYNDIEQGREKSKTNQLIAATNILDSNGYDLTDPKIQAIRRNLDDTGKNRLDVYAANAGYKVDDVVERDALKDRLLDPNDQVKDSEILAAPISRQTKESFLSLNSEKQKNTESYQRKVGTYVSEKELISTKIKELGIKNKKDIGAFQSRVQQELQNYKNLTGQEAGREEKEKIINDLTFKQSTGWFSSDYKFKIKPDIAQIPQAKLDEIKAALVAARRPVTDQNIISLYELGEQQDGE